MTTYVLAGQEVEQIADEIINEFHRHIHMLNIAYLFADDSVTSGGNITQFGVRKIPSWMSGFVTEQAAVWIEKTFWDQATDNQRRAILDHCLSQIYLTDSGFSLGKPPLQTFPVVVKRWGLWNRDLQNLKGAVDQYEQIGLFKGAELDHDERGVPRITVNMDENKARREAEQVAAQSL